MGRLPFNQYAATETGDIAAETTVHQGMSLFEDHMLVEVVDEDYRPVPPGFFGDKVLVTVLFNHTQPLIRYELSESIRFSREAGDGRHVQVRRRPTALSCARECHASILACLTDLKVPSHLTSLDYSYIAYSLHATWRGTQSS